MANYNPPTNGFDKRPDDINKDGAPEKPWTWRGEIIKALERATPDGTPMKQGVAEALVDKALQGDVLAIKEIGNRADGMPVQKQVLAGDEENPIQIDISGILAKVYGSENDSSTDEVHSDSP